MADAEPLVAMGTMEVTSQLAWPAWYDAWPWWKGVGLPCLRRCTASPTAGMDIGDFHWCRLAPGPSPTGLAATCVYELVCPATLEPCLDGRTAPPALCSVVWVILVRLAGFVSFGPIWAGLGCLGGGGCTEDPPHIRIRGLIHKFECPFLATSPHGRSFPLPPKCDGGMWPHARC